MRVLIIEPNYWVNYMRMDEMCRKLLYLLTPITGQQNTHLRNNAINPHERFSGTLKITISPIMKYINFSQILKPEKFTYTYHDV